MNEEAEPRRLTRRELREQWQAEQASLDSANSEENVTESEMPDLAYVQEAKENANEAWSEEGEEAQVRMRRRRREAEQEENNEQPADVDEVALAAEAEVTFTVEPTPTQPFTLADLEQLEVDVEQSDQELFEEDIEIVDAEIIDDLAEPEAEVSEVSVTEEIVSEIIESDIESVEESDVSLQIEDDAEVTEFDLDETAVNFESDSVLPQQNSYTFPDIKPLDDDRSVFDDDSTRVTTPAPAEPRPKGEDETNFDDLLERAIADESASVHNSTAALILPAFPDSDLTGPLGATGELFITGSFELPKSLSETGGHSSMLDRYDTDDSEDYPQTQALETEEKSEQQDAFANLETTQFDVAPKSARKAVSAKSDQSDLPTTPITKGDSKKPLVFGLVGGGLILILAAGAIYLYNSGLFG